MMTFEEHAARVRRCPQPHLLAPAPAKVYPVRLDDPAIALPRRQVVDTIDMACDRRCGNLYVYASAAGGFAGKGLACLQVSAWSSAGDLLAEWRLPEGLSAASVLFEEGGLLRLIAWQVPDGPPVLVSLHPRPSGEVTVEPVPGGYLAYDEALDRETARAVRSLRQQFGWPAPPRFGQPNGQPVGRTNGLFALPELQQALPVNARLVYDHMAWSSDFSVLAYGWDDAYAWLEVAFRQEDGSYDVGCPAGRMLVWPEAKLFGSWAPLSMVAVEEGAAAFALDYLDGFGGGSRPFVGWIDGREAPREFDTPYGHEGPIRDHHVACCEPGFLARTLQAYG